MGKKPLRTTKSGRYINPTDQFRKEERRRELKKNKKQREIVRAALIKSKEPKALLEEMEQLDEMEFNPVKSNSINPRVLHDKRKKLNETMLKIKEMMEKTNPESLGEFRLMMANYEKRREQKLQYFEQVKNAESVRPDQIPLPSEIPPPPSSSLSSGSTSAPLHSILKKPTITITDGSSFGKSGKFRPLKNIPPPPPCLPPDLSDSDDDHSVSQSSEGSVNSDSPADLSDSSGPESEHEERIQPKKSIRFAEDVPDTSKDTRLTVGRERQRRPRGINDEDETPYDPEQPVETEPSRSQQPPPGMPPYNMPPQVFPPPGMNPRMPPPPYMQGYTDVQPPREIRRLPGGKLVLSAPPGVVQAAPTTVQRDSAQLTAQQHISVHQIAPPPVDPKVATIEKKAQLKKKDATKFIPPQLQVRREFKDSQGRIIKQSAPKSMTNTSGSAVASQNIGYTAGTSVASSAAVAAAKGADKDDSYAQFMKSLEGLI